MEFPFTVSVTKNLLGFYGFRSRLFRYPAHMEFLQRGHPLHGLEIMVGITREFVRLAQERGKTPLVVILPHAEDIRYFQKTGTWPYQPVVDAYVEQDVDFIDFGPHLVSIMQPSSARLGDYVGPTAHFNDAGNACVAEFVFAALVRRQLLP